ncbi:hypothetical protein TIFTF001_017870 [Ficus carica]|uniref:Uncharacterized protein n=1 Tax=Ficus carica TaxID=3494 RepID=A0AA88A362_FICCA|nr:hypothetical protein TIFTF001_017870 [Ficus carica]
MKKLIHLAGNPQAESKDRSYACQACTPRESHGWSQPPSVAVSPGRQQPLPSDVLFFRLVHKPTTLLIQNPELSFI